MAKFKITITLDGELLTDVHAAVEAMNTELKKHGGSVTRVQLARPDRDKTCDLRHRGGECTRCDAADAIIEGLS